MESKVNFDPLKTSKSSKESRDTSRQRQGLSSQRDIILLVNRVLDGVQELAGQMSVPYSHNVSLRGSSNEEYITAQLQFAEQLLNKMIEHQKGSAAKPSLVVGSEPSPGLETELSRTALKLMDLRDWILTAQVGDLPVSPEVLDEICRQLEDLLKGEPSPNLSEQLSNTLLFAQESKIGEALIKQEVLTEIYTKLGQILEDEGILAFEETGLYNVEQQEVSGTHDTDDPAQKNFVCDSVNPGYRFHGRLIRPQKVTIYTLRERG